MLCPLGAGVARSAPVLRLDSAVGGRMAADQRDWYRDWWRKKTGYVERASFRVSESEFQRLRRGAAWRSVFIKAFLLVLVLVAVVFAKRLF